MDKWEGKIAVVTGTSSGIGLAVATQLVEAGLEVVGLAPHGEKDQLSTALVSRKGKYYHIEADVGKEEDIQNVYKWIEENLGVVHILINNAGIGKNTNLIDGETCLWKQIFDVNVIGLCMMTREAVKIMRKNNVHGHIIHVNSLSGHRVQYFASGNVYAASKCAVTALTETLRQELNSIGSKIKISSVSPGIVNTKFFERMGAIDLKNQIRSKIVYLDPEDVADAIVYILSTPPNVQIHDLLIRPQGQTT